VVVTILVSIASIACEIVAFELGEVLLDVLIILIPQGKRKSRWSRVLYTYFSQLIHLALLTLVIKSHEVKPRNWFSSGARFEREGGEVEEVGDHWVARLSLPYDQ
jgi:hypothetical protein